MLVLVFMSMLISYASVDFFVLSFVLSCAYAYVTSDAGQITEVYSELFGSYRFLRTSDGIPTQISNSRIEVFTISKWLQTLANFGDIQ